MRATYADPMAAFRWLPALRLRVRGRRLVRVLLLAALLPISAYGCNHSREASGVSGARRNPMSSATNNPGLDTMVDQKVSLSGTAMDSKAGAVLVADDDTIVYLEDVDYWDASFAGKPVGVTGTLRRKQAIPPAAVADDGAISQGMDGDQWVLEDPQWRLGP